MKFIVEHHGVPVPAVKHTELHRAMIALMYKFRLWYLQYEDAVIISDYRYPIAEEIGCTVEVLHSSPIQDQSP